MVHHQLQSLRAKLDEVSLWPDEYVFKFIVPAPQVGEVEALFAGREVVRRPSKNGNYVGVTVRFVVQSTDEVIGYYERALEIPGIMAL